MEPISQDISNTGNIAGVIAPEQFTHEFQQELRAILQYWLQYTVDETNGGFYGSVTNDNIPDTTAPKGLVLNSRILWAFAAAATHEYNQQYKEAADRSFDYIQQYFIDLTHGGAYWSVDAAGKPLDTKKQVYGIAFCIYGLSEYVKLTRSDQALQLAIDLYNNIETHARDITGEGYIEAFREDWSVIADLRLSDKDSNTPKTTNTHLHIVEAYANLYEVWPDEQLRKNIKNLLTIFDQFIIDRNTYHLKLFFTREWQSQTAVCSFGHDIEAAWLLQHCAEVIESSIHTQYFKSLAVKMAQTTLNWVDKDGALWYELDISSKTINRQKHWWVQAEAMVGFYNAYQLTGNKLYVQLCGRSWQFIQQYLIDTEKGEWFWGIDEKGQLLYEPKAGFWKCPYHNVRACLQLIGRMQKHQPVT
ncbi:AGE family epimerase/isomerase [Terrimonas rubra]|uniref:Cellobiose 2-epimerase n=1 Tax=Terrimonas rubra TaxID=1035890 RepID=A0ABW6A4D9_9BACT